MAASSAAKAASLPTVAGWLGDELGLQLWDSAHLAALGLTAIEGAGAVILIVGPRSLWREVGVTSAFIGLAGVVLLVRGQAECKCFGELEVLNSGPWRVAVLALFLVCAMVVLIQYRRLGPDPGGGR